jgi:hypothetical protein
MSEVRVVKVATHLADITAEGMPVVTEAMKDPVEGRVTSDLRKPYQAE